MRQYTLNTIKQKQNWNTLKANESFDCIVLLVATTFICHILSSSSWPSWLGELGQRYEGGGTEIVNERKLIYVFIRFG